MQSLQTFFRIVLALLVLVAPAFVHGADATRLVFDDLPRFWQAYDAGLGQSAEARVAIFQRDYLDAGSPGLKAFTRLRIGDARELVAVIDRHPKYYAHLRGLAERLPALEPGIRASLARMQALAGAERIPDVTFVIGRMNSGGTIADEGLLVGLELFGKDDTAPLDELDDWSRAVVGPASGLPHLVTHELVHALQTPASGTPTLLAQSLREGIADFLAELASGRHISGHVHAWAEPRARELWAEFREVMDGTETRGWLYDTSGLPERPADLGYWMGYRIARAYHDRAEDRAAAIRDMLLLEDPPEFLAQSGIRSTFETPQ